MTKQKNKKFGLGKYFKQHKLAIILYTLCYVIAGALSVFETLLFAQAIERITIGQYLPAIYIGLIIIASVIVRRLCWYFTGIIYDVNSVKIIAAINKDLATQAFKLNSKTYSDHETGAFVQRIVQDPERVVEKFADMVDFLVDILVAAVMLVYISTLSWVIGLCVIVMIGVGLLLEYLRVKIRRKTRHVMHKEHDKIHSLTTEIVKSEKDIKSLGLEDALSKVSEKNYDRYRRAMFKHNMVDMNFWAGRNLLIEVLGIVMLIIAISMMNKALMTLASFMIIYSSNGNGQMFIRGIGSIMTNIVDIKVSANRMLSLFDEDEFVTEKFGSISVEKINGNIEFREVGFTFKDYEYNFNFKTKKSDKKLVGEKRVFKNLSFKIEQNKTVAFVGKSGSGKSTILNLMSKMFEVGEGKVLIDGYNINDLDKQTLRKTFSLVNQFPYIFDMTIKENLLLANDKATDEQIENALEKAYLKEFVDSLPKGLDTKVGESGIKLSGGQKQRLAIARALLRKSPIILFDESTSSLDNFAQTEVKKSIDGLKGSSTIVIVAHRLSTIKDADLIYFLDDGEIIGQGTFEELCQSNQKFKNMFLAENI